MSDDTKKIIFDALERLRGFDDSGRAVAIAVLSDFLDLDAIAVLSDFLDLDAEAHENFGHADIIEAVKRDATSAVNATCEWLSFVTDRGFAETDLVEKLQIVGAAKGEGR